MIEAGLKLILKRVRFKQNSVWMLSWKCIHWWVVIHNILLWIDAIFSKAEIVKRIVDFVKPEKEHRMIVNSEVKRDLLWCW